MAALLGILTCRPIRAVEGRIKLTSDDRMLSKKSQSINATKSKVEDLKYRLRCESTATSIVNVLLNAETVNPTLGAEIASLVHKKAGGWSVYLATKVLYSVETVLRARQVLNGAMKVARDKAYEAARVFESFRAEDPAARAVFMAVIAIGVLVILAPYMIELLGFAEMGPVQGKHEILHEKGKLIIGISCRYLGCTVAEHLSWICAEAVALQLLSTT